MEVNMQSESLNAFLPQFSIALLIQSQHAKAKYQEDNILYRNT